MLRKLHFFALPLLFAGTALLRAQTVPATPDDTVLKQVIIFGRHGVRSAAFPASTLATFATRPYPDTPMASRSLM